jgi:ADP-ribose pyrophosphatase
MMTDRNRTTDNDLEWKEISCEHLVQDEWIDFRRSAYRLPDGSVFEPFYSYSRRNFVVIVATDEEGNYICVKQYRHGIQRVTTEFCAGGIERTDGKEYGGKQDGASEDALAAAKRELEEETGYASAEWRHLFTVPAQPTIADNFAIIFEAKNCRKISSQHLDETEFLNTVLLSREELAGYIEDGSFPQPVHILGLMLSEQ